MTNLQQNGALIPWPLKYVGGWDGTGTGIREDRDVACFDESSTCVLIAIGLACTCAGSSMAS